MPVTLPHKDGPVEVLGERRAVPQAPDNAYGGNDDDHPGGDRGRRGAPREWPLWLAVTAIVLVASLLTTLGMFSQILANLAGSQLPGA